MPPFLGVVVNIFDDLDTANIAYLKGACSEYVSSDHIRVGLLWSSSLAVGLRKERYGIPKDSFERFIQSFFHFDCDFFSLQSPLLDDDKCFCKENNINILDNLDLYNDFYNSSRFLKTLDYVIGPSSLMSELAAASGCKFLHIANAPEIAFMRNGSTSSLSKHDQLSNNTITLCPINGYRDSKININNSCLEVAMDIIMKDNKGEKEK